MNIAFTALFTVWVIAGILSMVGMILNRVWLVSLWIFGAGSALLLGGLLVGLWIRVLS